MLLLFNIFLQQKVSYATLRYVGRVGYQPPAVALFDPHAQVCFNPQT